MNRRTVVPTSFTTVSVFASLCGWLTLHADDSMPLASARELFADQPKGLSEKIMAWKLIYVGEVLGNPIGGERQGAVYEGYAKFGIGFNLEKAFGWEGASFYTNVLYPHGSSLTDGYVHDLNVVSNIDAFDSIRLYKLWFQQSFADNRFSLRIGQMAADKEFFVSDSASLFFNNAFGSPPIFSQSISAPIYPLSAPGVRLRWDPSPAFSLRTAIFSGDVGSQTTNQHQTRLRLDAKNGALMLIEAAYKTAQVEGSSGLPGTFKAGAYLDTKYFDDQRGGANHHGDDGFYVIGDQQVYRAATSDGTNRGLSVFARCGFAPADRNLVDAEFETGFNYVGLLRTRAKDIAGLGLAFTHISPQAQQVDGEPVLTRHETILEGNYLATINDWCSVQPDVQYIFNPGAIERRRGALICGLRVTLSF